jgi:hypothetical protein
MHSIGHKHMKRIKKINEDWSSDYTYDFTDHGFEVEENGNILTGKYKGPFVMTQLNDWFAEMTAKMSDDHDVARAKTYFNQVTGNANFEVEIAPGRNFSIEVQVGNETVEYFPLSIYSYHLFDSRVNARKCLGSIWLKGSYKNGQKKELGIIREHLRDRAGNQIEDTNLKISLGARGRGISISKEELSKLFGKIFSNDLKFVSAESKAFIELSPNDQERVRRFKNQIVS